MNENRKNRSARMKMTKNDEIIRTIKTEKRKTRNFYFLLFEE